jgi:hypothetical protein
VADLKRANLHRKWSTIPKAKSNRGCVAAIDSNGRTIWFADAHRGDGQRLIVHADEKLTAFLELERVTRNDTHRNQTAIVGLESF